MDSVRQLVRHPVKTLLGILLMIIACALLCVSIGQYYEAVLTSRRVEAEYTTIALPTSKFQSPEPDEEGVVTEYTFLQDQPWAIQKFLADLPTRFPQAVRSSEQHDFISGYCSGTELLNYTQIFPQATGNALAHITTAPYSCAMFVITIDEISDVFLYVAESAAIMGINPDDYGVVAYVTGTVLEVCALQSGYECPVGRTIHLEIREESEEAFSGLGLEAGERYLVYGTDYVDENWFVKCWISKDQKFYDNISWDNIILLTEEEKRRFSSDKDSYDDGSFEAKYMFEVDGEELWISMSQSDLEMIDSCRMTVCSDPAVLHGYLTEEEIQLFFTDGEPDVISLEEYRKRYQQAGIAHLDSSAAEFLEAQENRIWQDALRTAEIDNHSFPVIATDNLQSIAQFGAQDAFIASGRRFSEEEYEQGKPVCVISESLAVQNGLAVGDHISIQYYEDDKNMLDWVLLQPANPAPHFYSPWEGFSSEEIAYEIVGLYRQKQEWTRDDYSFTPNTIFVPKKSVCGQTETSSSGIFRTFVLENGMTQWLEEELTALGYDGLLAYYDQGYSNIAASLSEYFAVARKILLAAFASWCVLVAVFLFLFPGHQKQTAKRMWTLGAPRSWVVKHILVSGMGIVLPGLVLGGIVSVGLMRSLLIRAGDYAGVSLELTQAFLVAAVLVLVQFAGLAGLTLMVAGNTVRTFYGKQR